MQASSEEIFLIVAAVVTMFIVGAIFIGFLFWMNRRLNEENQQQRQIEDQLMRHQQDEIKVQSNGYHPPEQWKAAPTQQDENSRSDNS